MAIEIGGKNYNVALKQQKYHGAVKRVEKKGKNTAEEALISVLKGGLTLVKGEYPAKTKSLEESLDYETMKRIVDYINSDDSNVDNQEKPFINTLFENYEKERNANEKTVEISEDQEVTMSEKEHCRDTKGGFYDHKDTFYSDLESKNYSVCSNRLRSVGEEKAKNILDEVLKQKGFSVCLQLLLYYKNYTEENIYEIFKGVKSSIPKEKREEITVEDLLKKIDEVVETSIYSDETPKNSVVNPQENQKINENDQNEPEKPKEDEERAFIDVIDVDNLQPTKPEPGVTKKFAELLVHAKEIEALIDMEKNETKEKIAQQQDEKDKKKNTVQQKDIEEPETKTAQQQDKEETAQQQDDEEQGIIVQQQEEEKSQEIVQQGEKEHEEEIIQEPSTTSDNRSASQLEKEFESLKRAKEEMEQQIKEIDDEINKFIKIIMAYASGDRISEMEKEAKIKFEEASIKGTNEAFLEYEQAYEQYKIERIRFEEAKIKMEELPKIREDKSKNCVDIEKRMELINKEAIEKLKNAEKFMESFEKKNDIDEDKKKDSERIV